VRSEVVKATASKVKECEYNHIYKETVCIGIKCAVLSGYLQHKLIDRTEFEMIY